MQRSFDDLGTPLHDVTFCVVDLETTGGSPADCRITEIGAVKLRGGACLGTFATLVNPGVAVPPNITVLTGITDAMVRPAPRVEAVLPSFLEFAAGTVLVGHNVRFDLSFLHAAAARAGYDRLANRSIDTCALSRRLFADEMPNHRLATLAERLRLPHRPTHRALDDALATGHLLHVLLERAGSLGVLGLDDLLELPTIKGHPQLAKLKLTDRLPRSPGVYLFRDAGGRVLYVGKATNLRSRVRSYFSGDERRKVGQLLRETVAIDHIDTATAVEAAVLEVWLIHQHLPRFNRQATTWRRYAYLKLTLNE
ncbi:MAG: GIY-YIG nuclease family protein, partial [Acidobacteria bacterium]|nr:GIY-YIG nuclease family protein [Acidobacteriota bacterium]